MLGGYEDDVVLETGDPEMDEVERRLAAGEDPETVLAGWGEGEGGKSQGEKRTQPLAQAAKEERRADEDEEFDDDYRTTDEPTSSPLAWSNSKE